MPKRSQVQGDNSRITSVVVVVQNLKKRRSTTWENEVAAPARIWHLLRVAQLKLRGTNSFPVMLGCHEPFLSKFSRNKI